MSMTAAARQRYYARHFKSDHARKGQIQLRIPDDVQRFEGDGSPCFNCESRGPCRHRPWMLQR